MYIKQMVTELILKRYNQFMQRKRFRKEQHEWTYEVTYNGKVKRYET